jgi:LmbE family N-acetylglucosaminyl deacetylase
MQLHLPTADVFVPDGLPPGDAFSRITHLGVGAHQDDLEFMAFHGILECFHQESRWFGGVTCTDGGGSTRAGRYAGCSDARMREIRKLEQRRAAELGEYAAMVQLDYPSTAIKDPADRRLADDLETLLRLCRPAIVYTHNPADKHETHIAVLAALIEAVRRLPADERPDKLLGCEVWRDLDWMPDGEKVLLDVSGADHLAAALNGIFDSQIAGGKRYDLAVIGRRQANATFIASHGVDQASAVTLAMDLTPLARDASLDATAFVLEKIDRFRSEVEANLQRYLHR